MKKTVKILSVLLGFILALTPILSLTVSASDAANGQSSTYNTEYSNETTRGNLVITEIFAGNPSDYQFIEIMNVSATETLNLAEYYLYRAMRGNQSGDDEAVTRILLGEYDWAAGYDHVTKLQITTDTTVQLEPREVAILYLKHSDKDVAAFKETWTAIPNDIQVITVEVPSTVVCKSIYTHNNVITENNGFLPNGSMDCIISLVHEDATIQVNGVPTKFCTTDALDAVDNKNSTSIMYYAYFKDRYEAADCNAVFNTDKAGESQTNSHNFYGWANMNVCDELITVASGNFSNFVTSKLTETGEYDAATNNGVSTYAHQSGSPKCCFFADGTDAKATPGTLNAGQFGYNSIKVLGYQTNTENDLRIVASFEADALMANAVGFEIVANIGGTEKTLDKECYKVYAKLGGSVKVGENTVSPLDKEYLATIGTHDYYVALTITDIDADVTFTVKPYVLNGTLKQYGETATITYTAPEA